MYLEVCAKLFKRLMDTNVDNKVILELYDQI